MGKGKLDTPLLRDLVFRYLEHTVHGEGWMKGETHDRIADHICQRLKINKDLNWRLVYVSMKEYITDNLTGTVGMKWSFVTRRDLNTSTKKFVERLEKLVPFIERHAVKEEGEDWLIRDKEILALCDAELPLLDEANQKNNAHASRLASRAAHAGLAAEKKDGNSETSS